MHGWAERWLCPDGPPLRLIDRRTSAPITAVVCDRNTGLRIDPRAIRWEIEAAAPVETSAA